LCVRTGIHHLKLLSRECATEQFAANAAGIHNEHPDRGIGVKAEHNAYSQCTEGRKNAIQLFVMQMLVHNTHKSTGKSTDIFSTPD
jgi:hypothetical protein